MWKHSKCLQVPVTFASNNREDEIGRLAVTLTNFVMVNLEAPSIRLDTRGLKQEIIDIVVEGRGWYVKGRWNQIDLVKEEEKAGKTTQKKQEKQTQKAAACCGLRVPRAKQSSFLTVFSSKVIFYPWLLKTVTELGFLSYTFYLYLNTVRFIFWL